MTFGEKIKRARKLKKMTQAQLAGDMITRNMLSRIESGTANPSLETAKYLANALSLPISYLLSDGDDLLFYEKNEKMGLIYDAFGKKDYSYCINKIESFLGVDNELSYILACSYFELGKQALYNGALKTALNNLGRAIEYSEKTVFDTKSIVSVASMYISISENIQAPLLEFDPEKYLSGLYEVFDYEAYKYLIQDYEYEYNDERIRLHVLAKTFMRERRYAEAVKPLDEAAAKTLENHYNAFLLFAIYTDLEQCYRQLCDFENAYRYSSKRMSMLEGFKS